MFSWPERKRDQRLVSELGRQFGVRLDVYHDARDKTWRVYVPRGGREPEWLGHGYTVGAALEAARAELEARAGTVDKKAARDPAARIAMKKRNKDVKLVPGQKPYFGSPDTVRKNIYGDGRWYVVNKTGVWSIAGWPTAAAALRAASKIVEIKSDGSTT